MSLKMSEGERQEFLAGVHVGVVAVAREGSSAPLAVPIWYGYQPGGEVELWTEQGSLKERLIRAAGRFSLCVHNEEQPYRYVSVDGPVTSWAAPSRDKVLALASRYMFPDEASRYVEENFSDDFVLIRMRPERWFSMDEAKAS